MDGETPKRLYSEVVASGVQQGCLKGKDNSMVTLKPLAAARRTEKTVDQTAREKKPRDFKTSGAKVNGADAKEKPKDSKTSGARVNGADAKNEKQRKWKCYYLRIHYRGERKKLMDLDFSGFAWKGAEPTEMGKLQNSPLWSSTGVQSVELLEKAGVPTLVGSSLQSVVPTNMESSEDPTLVSDSLQPVLPTKMEISGDLTFLDRISKLAHGSQSLFERRSEKLQYPQDYNDGNIDDMNSQKVIKMISDVIQDDEPIHVTQQEVSALLKSERGQTVSDPLLPTMHPRSENPPIPESFSMWNWTHPCNSFRPTPTETSPWHVGASSLEKEAVAETFKALLQNHVTDSRETQSCRKPEHEILGSGPREQENTTQDVADPWLVHPLTIKLKSERDIYKAKAEKAEQDKKSALILVDQLHEELKALKEAANPQTAKLSRQHVPRATAASTSQTDRNTLKTSGHRHNVAKRQASSTIPYPYLPSTISEYPYLPSDIPENPCTSCNAAGGDQSSSNSQPNAPVYPNTNYQLFSPNHQNQIYPVTNSYAPVSTETTSGEAASSGGPQSSSDFPPRAPAACGDAEGRARMAALESFVLQSSNPNQERLNELYPKPIHRAPQPVWSNGYITRPMPEVPVTVTPDGLLS